MKDKYTTDYSGTYSKPVLPGNTIMNNNPATTFYSLSILELVELCDQYQDEEIDNKHSTIELIVDYIKKNRI